ncbi:MAG: hypothetical protein IJ047_05005 [Paludibacteraceae bacterium]|nr:hypothetical protein [Paludibacteraceae bacterium]
MAETTGTYKKMSRRAIWGQRMLTGTAMITNSLPDWFATYSFAAYLVALVGVNILFAGRGTEWYFWLFGIAWVAGFFYLSVKYSREWSVLKVHKVKSFEKKLFQTGFLIRAAYVVFIYFFYLKMTGQPHEFGSADSMGYIEVAEDWVRYLENDAFGPVLGQSLEHSFSDTGFPLYVTPFVYIFGVEFGIFMILIANALLGAFTPVIIYRIASRSMTETTARLAAIFCMLHPVLICYAGMTLKEVLMTFLLVLFIDMADRMLRSKHYSFATIAPTVLVGLSLFMFRTVLGMIAFMAVFFALVMVDSRVTSIGKKVVLGLVLVGIILFSVSDNIMREVNQIRETDVMGQQQISMTKRYGSEKGGKLSGNRFANKVGAAVFAPLIFTIPFPTMVVTEGQEDMRLIHGGNWMRNIMSGFVIFAMFLLLFTGDWRQHTLPLAMLLGYLVMLTFTQFAHSLRFHIPVMPFEMMFAAYAITNMRKKHRTWYLAWCLFTIVTCFAWNWFKLAGRGMA